MNKNICLIICFIIGVLVFMMIRGYCSCDIEGYCCKAGCTEDSNCNNPGSIIRNKCIDGQCECSGKWTGPNCGVCDPPNIIAGLNGDVCLPECSKETCSEDTPASSPCSYNVNSHIPNGCSGDTHYDEEIGMFYLNNQNGQKIPLNRWCAKSQKIHEVFDRYSCGRGNNEEGEEGEESQDPI